VSSLKGLSILEPADRAFDRSFEFVRGSTHRQLDGGSLMGHGDRLVARKPSFEHTPDIITLCFVAVCITEVRFDSSDPITKSANRSFNIGLDKGDDLFTSMDIVVRMNLHLHPTTSLT
jgi:hypothetical protein